VALAPYTPQPSTSHCATAGYGCPSTSTTSVSSPPTAGCPKRSRALMSTCASPGAKLASGVRKVVCVAATSPSRTTTTSAGSTVTFATTSCSAYLMTPAARCPAPPAPGNPEKVNSVQKGELLHRNHSLPTDVTVCPYPVTRFCVAGADTGTTPAWQTHCRSAAPVGQRDG
jgi:hypothetical protein